MGIDEKPPVRTEMSLIAKLLTMSGILNFVLLCCVAWNQWWTQPVKFHGEIGEVTAAHYDSIRSSADNVAIVPAKLHFLYRQLRYCRRAREGKEQVLVWMRIDFRSGDRDVIVVFEGDTVLVNGMCFWADTELMMDLLTEKGIIAK